MLLAGMETDRKVGLVIQATNIRSDIIIAAVKAMFVSAEERTDSREDRMLLMSRITKSNMDRAVKALNEAHEIAVQIMEEELSRIHSIKK